jgi:hypothetical protein
MFPLIAWDRAAADLATQTATSNVPSIRSIRTSRFGGWHDRCFRVDAR